MITEYYELDDDKRVRGRCYLGSVLDVKGNSVDPRVFTVGTGVSVDGPLQVTVRHSGIPLDFTLADFGMPVVADGVADMVRRVAGDRVQLLAARVVGASERYWILNVLTVLDCLDVDQSEVSYWGPDDGRPELVGRPFSVVNLHVDRGRARGEPIFRISHWLPPIMVSHVVREELGKTLGATFIGA